MPNDTPQLAALTYLLKREKSHHADNSIEAKAIDDHLVNLDPSIRESRIAQKRAEIELRKASVAGQLADIDKNLLALDEIATAPTTT